MRFIGNKTKLVEYIHDALSRSEFIRSNPTEPIKFYDFFAGTGSVGRFFKSKGYYVEASDILYFSYVLQKAFIENTGEPAFRKLLLKLDLEPQNKLFSSPYEQVVEHLNSLTGIEGFTYKHYTEEGTTKYNEEHVRKFFIGKNGMKIDAIRMMVEDWRENKLIDEREYFVLIATLVESVPFFANISGVYAAFLKQYDPRSVKELKLRLMHFSDSGIDGKAYFGNSMDRLEEINTDILYLDPPYNARQYAPNYHLLETICKYDNPTIKGVAGIREYSSQKSEFCNSKTAILALDKIASTAKYKVLALSYNSEGIMSVSEILNTLEKYGKATLHELDYRRFKSNSNGDSKHKTHIQELLFVLER